jgi:hypothetical protein
MASVLRNIVTVLSAFVGVRGKRNHDEAAASLTPVQVIITGVVAAALFVITLLVVVRVMISIA